MYKEWKICRWEIFFGIEKESWYFKQNSINKQLKIEKALQSFILIKACVKKCVCVC